ncbi:MAG: response regulator [Lachnospiraceae bacterium]|nr:response regulator [Lachnospiraceae bacterium]
MYRILIADDEGIMLESLKSVIHQNFGDGYEVITAKSGRAAIEQAESFHPDIVFMDIQMPGINGIQAIKEIRKFNSAALFYVISAYDKFDYAKEAISLGVERYLMKPITKKVIISVVEDAAEKVDENRRRRSDQLKIQEKLETVIPVVENGLVGNILIQNDWQDAEYYKQLLDVPEDYGYAIVFCFGTEFKDGKLLNPVGLSVKAQSFYPEFRAIVKSYIRCIIGSVMSNRIVAVVPFPREKMEYEERIRAIEDTRAIVGRLEERLEARFRAGIGRCYRLKDLRSSYQEAFRALNESKSRVIHTDDISRHGVYEGDFPVDTEQNMFQRVIKGDVEGMQQEANRFFDWMIEHYPDSRNNIRLKVLEFILWAEKEAFHEGAVNYGFEYRKDYLTSIMELEDYEEIRHWFLDKMTSVCSSVRNKKEEQSESVVTKAKNFIRDNYQKDISLDDVSKEVNVSPYYFSKLFKEEAGENFIEYLTRLRMEKAKEMLRNPGVSVKEISLQCGYGDPNYFSRIFKKQTDMTPREFRERYC